MHLIIDDTNVATIEKSFHKIADELINNHVLVAGNSSYQISNLEFYYYNEKSHRDENCHALRYKKAKIRQLLNSKWHLHNKGFEPTYKHKGIDFTFGDGINFGGILIKETRRIEDNTKFSQSKFIDELISVLKPKDENELILMIEEEEKLRFERTECNNKYSISRHKRIRLAKETFKNSLYAFVIPPIQ